MINLMPPEVKTARMYGRRNRSLLRWCLAAGLATVGILLIAGGGYFYITQAETSAAADKQELENQMSSEKYDEILNEYTAFSSNLKTVVQILNKQVVFSELIQQIGSTIPPGATLNTISISNKDNALTLDFAVNSASVAPTLQLNLEDPDNGLFEKADIVQVSCQTDTVSNTQSCSVIVRVLLKKDANYFFLNSVNSSESKQ